MLKEVLEKKRKAEGKEQTERGIYPAHIGSRHRRKAINFERYRTDSGQLDDKPGN